MAKKGWRRIKYPPEFKVWLFINRKLEVDTEIEGVNNLNILMSTATDEVFYGGFFEYTTSQLLPVQRFGSSEGKWWDSLISQIKDA